MGASTTLELLDAEEVAKLLHVSLATIRSWTSEGRIPFYRVGGRAVRYGRAEILDWLQSQRVAPKAAS